MEKFYKYSALIFLFLFLGSVGWFFWKQKLADDHIRQLSNQLALTQQLVKETATAYSSAALEMDNLKAKNKDLQSVIKKKQEEIFSLTDIAIQWKNQYWEIKNATGTIVDNKDPSSTQPVSLPTECLECLKNVRFRVDFEREQENLKLSGYTLTNPAFATISLEWTKPLMLQLVLTRSQEGVFKVYVDSPDKSFIPTELALKVDPSVFARKWYENIGVSSTIAASQYGFTGSVNAFYNVRYNVFIGPSVSLQYNASNSSFQAFYGAIIGYYPFMRKP